MTTQRAVVSTLAGIAVTTLAVIVVSTFAGIAVTTLAVIADLIRNPCLVSHGSRIESGMTTQRAVVSTLAGIAVSTFAVIAVSTFAVIAVTTFAVIADLIRNPWCRTHGSRVGARDDAGGVRDDAGGVWDDAGGVRDDIREKG